MTATIKRGAKEHGHGNICRGLIVGLFAVVSMTSGVKASPVAYTDETAYLTALSGLGYTPAYEGFEDNSVWGGARTTSTSSVITIPSVTGQGLTWSSNFSGGEITTSEGAARRGNWGLYSNPHGSYLSSTADCTVPGACSDGLAGSAVSGLLYAVGGYFRTNTPTTELGMFVGNYPNNPVDFGETCTSEENCISNSLLGTTYKFFGVIDVLGFTAFEYRELEGTSGDRKFIFADDFTFAGSNIGAPTIPNPGALPLLLSALCLIGAMGWRRKSTAAS